MTELFLNKKEVFKYVVLIIIIWIVILFHSVININIIEKYLKIIFYIIWNDWIMKFLLNIIIQLYKQYVM